MPVRDLLCNECGQGEVVKERHGMHMALVEGILRLEGRANKPRLIRYINHRGVVMHHTVEEVQHLLCDRCTRLIERGEHCYCRTYWHDPEERPLWEDQYLFAAKLVRIINW